MSLRACQISNGDCSAVSELSAVVVSPNRNSRSSGGTPSRSQITVIGSLPATSTAKSQTSWSSAALTRARLFSSTAWTTPASTRGENALSSTLRRSRCRGPSVTAAITPLAESPPCNRVASTFPFAELNRSVSR